MTIDRRALRAQISAMTPEEVTEALGCLGEACGEYARELKIPAAQFLQHMADCYAQAHGKELHTFEATEGPGGFIDTVVVFAPRWRMS